MDATKRQDYADELAFIGRHEKHLLQAVLDGLAHPILGFDPAGRLFFHNLAASTLLGRALDRGGLRCCDLLGCGRGAAERPLAFHCISAAAIERGSALREFESVIRGMAVVLAASPLEDALGVVVEIRPATRGDRPERTTAPRLQITTLGSMQLKIGDARLDGDWLHHRPGQVLKYLICARGHRVPSDEMLEALWPGGGRTAITSLRQAVHMLRDRLEPDRPRNEPSTFVTGSAGGYQLNPATTVVDADGFETEAHAALLSRHRGDDAVARLQLFQAAKSYTGTFLPDERYTEWALEERDRLRGLAARVLRELANLHLDRGELPPAMSALQRVSDLDPLDPEVHRELIALFIRHDRHADAARRYELFRTRFRRAFDREPGFALADLAGDG